MANSSPSELVSTTAPESYTKTHSSVCRIGLSFHVDPILGPRYDSCHSCQVLVIAASYINQTPSVVTCNRWLPSTDMERILPISESLTCSESQIFSKPGVNAHTPPAVDA